VASVGTIVTNLVANTTKFTAGFKKAQQDVKGMESQLKKLQATAKFGLGLFAGEKVKSFLKNTIKEATTAGSELQDALGSQGVKAAEKLAQSVGKIELALQKTVIVLAQELMPLLEKGADLIGNLADRVSGGPQGKLKTVMEERKTPLDFTKPQDAIETLLGQRTALERERATVMQGRGMFDFRTKWEKQNQADLLDSKLFTVNTELEGLQANKSALERRGTIAAMGTKAKQGAQLFGSVGRNLLTGAGQSAGFLNEAFGIGAGAKSLLSRGGGLADLLSDSVGRAREFAQSREQRLRDQIASRVSGMMGQTEAKGGAQLAVRGTNEFLQAIHDQPKAEIKKLEELVKLAKEEIAVEARQAQDIAREIARQRITVSMP
jgi:hypothetical protein